MIKSRKVRWAGHITRLRDKRNTDSVLMAKPEGDQEEYIDVSRRIILRWISEK
jgi:hypothetical protein